MRALVSRANAGMAAYWARDGRGICPVWSHALGSGGTPKTRVDWAFVSPVSPVSPNSILIDDYRIGELNRHGSGGTAAGALC